VSEPVAVVVVYEAAEHAAACLDRLAAVAPSTSAVVVANGGRSPAVVRLADGRPQVELLVPEVNLGFAGGANAGIGRAFAGPATHALLLNDDVLLEPGAVEALVASAGPDGAAAPRIEAPGSEAFDGAEIDWRRGFGRHVPGRLDYLTGAALCIARAAWERAGPFDERLFLYYEDVDWSLRARAAGVPLRLSDARATHAVGSSTSGAVHAYYSTRNRLWFLERERGRPVARREAVRTAARAAVRGMVAPGVARARLEGVADWARGRMGRRRYPR
jgi:GT2 family glycosyltransferase